MTSNEWPRIKTLFDQALEHHGPGRSAFLDRACRDAPEVRAEVEALLAAYEQAEAAHAIESPFAYAPAPASTPLADGAPDEAATEAGRCVGPYRIVRLLGRGGMGNVFLAERADGQFHQTVALKLIRRGLDTDDVIARFAFERQVLAGLDHPNIARLYDGGVSEDGRPYFAMEYVEGEPITDYCDRHRLTIDERLALFRRVCSAVQHAHRNLVVHRDLKPSNILVTGPTAGGEGIGSVQIKLLDFGIAKLLAHDADHPHPNLPHTRTGNAVMTPEYAAPEQVRGEPVTTATDVYQLGLLLYELLAGRRPYHLPHRTHRDVVRAMLEDDPAPPSSVIHRAETTPPSDHAAPVPAERVAQARSTMPSRLQRRLEGDLDVICLTALREERARRYQDVEALAEDLRRHALGLPIAARPDTWSYRTSKFVRRHRRSMTAAVLVLASLLGGLATALWQARAAEVQRQRAEERLADVRQLAGSFLFEFHDAIADLPGSTAARELIVQRALDYLDRLSEQPDADASLRLELAEAYRKVGDVQGNPTNANLGRTSDALLSYRRGLELVDNVLQHDPANTAARRIRSHLYEQLGDVQAAMGRLADAATTKRRALREHRTLRGTADAPEEWSADYAVALIKLGDLLGNPNFPNQGQPADALRRYREARAVLGELYAADSSASNVLRLYGLIHERLGTIYDEQGQQEAALAAYRRSLVLRERYAEAHPTNTDAIRDRAVAYEKMGHMLVATNDLPSAGVQYRASRDIFQRLAEADPDNLQAQRSVAISHLHLGDLHYHPNRPSLQDAESARSHFSTALRYLANVQHADAGIVSLRTLVEDRLAGLP